MRTASAAQLAAWLVLSFACRHAWPEGQDGAFWGGLIMAMNIYFMRLIAGRLLPSGGGTLLVGNSAPAAQATPAAAHWPHWLPAALIAGKFVAMLVATAVVVQVVDPGPLGLLAGFSTLLVGILGAAVHTALPQKGADSPWTTIPPG